MVMTRRLDRRTFLSMATTGALAAPALLSARAAPGRTTASPWQDAIIVNALGQLTNPNADLSAAAKEGAPMSVREMFRLVVDDRALLDAHRSGLTAVNITLNHASPSVEPFEHAIRQIALSEGLLIERSDEVLKVWTAADIVRAKSQHKIGIIYGFQDTIMLGEQVERVDTFADLGVRIIQLTYNPANQVGDGAMAPENRGLTPFGREVVERLNANRIMVDLSHSGENTCLDAAKASRQPVSINHTGCRALADLPRNKTDAELRLVAARGGFVGIYFMGFLNTSRHASGDDVIAHIEHAIDVCGEDHVGIGTDGAVTGIDDMEGYKAAVARQVEERRAQGVSSQGEQGGWPFVPDLHGVNQFYDLADRLQVRGHSTARVEKILGRNFLRYARDVWGA